MPTYYIRESGRRYRQRIPKTYPKGKRLYHAAFFWTGSRAVSAPKGQTARSYIQPITTGEIAELLRLSGISQYDTRGITELVGEVAYYILNRVREEVRGGTLPHMEGMAPLRDLTIKKKQSLGKTEETPLFESGQLVDALVVERPRPRHGGPSTAGFYIHADTSLREDAWHKPNYPRGQSLPMSHLYNIVTRTGALIDLSSESVRRRVFGFYRALGLLGDKEAEEFIRGERPITKDGKLAPKRWIYIPPRPLFTENYIRYLSELAHENVVKPRLNNALKVAGRAFHYGPRMIKSKESFLQAKWRARMSFEQQMELE